MRRDPKPCRTPQMRRDPHPAVALGQRRAHAPKRLPLEHPEIAVNQSRRGAGSGAAEVALFEQNDPKTAPRGVARNGDTIQPAADDRKVVVRHARTIASSSDACPALIGDGYRFARQKETR